MSDSKHCGVCGVVCDAGKSCSAGACVPAGLTNCGGSYVDLLKEREHCGACGKVCDGVCEQGQCKPCTKDTDCPHQLSCDATTKACRCGSRCGWLQTMGGSQAVIEPRAMTSDPKGNIFLTGSWKGKATWGSFHRTSKGAEDIMIARVDSQGRRSWVLVLGSTDSDTGTDIAVFKDTIYVLGIFRSSVSFGQNTLSSRGESDIFLTALDMNGKFLWTEQIGGSGHDESYALAVSKEGSLYFTGTFSKQIKVGAFSLQTSHPYEMFLAKFDPRATTRKWNWLSAPGGQSVGTGISVKSGDGVFVAGHFQKTIALSQTSSLNAYGTSTLVVLKFKEQDGSLLKGVAALGTSSANGIALCPNGKLFVVGAIQGSVKLGVRTVSLQRPQDVGDMLIAELDSSLTFKRGITFSDKGFGEATSVVCDGTYLWVTGFFQEAIAWKNAQDTPSRGKNDAFLLKIKHTQAAGPSVSRVFSLGSTNNEQGSALNIGTQGLFVAGWFQGELTFPQTTQPTKVQGQKDAFLWKVAQ